jgi:hypothetical protein
MLAIMLNLLAVVRFVGNMPSGVTGCLTVKPYRA